LKNNFSFVLHLVVSIFISHLRIMQYIEFKKDLEAKLIKKLAIKNIHQVPKIDKVIVSIGVGSLHTRK